MIELMEKRYKIDDKNMNIKINENDKRDMDDINNDIYIFLIDILLKDRTTKKNIKWYTNNYQKFGIGYGYNDYISPSSLIKNNIENSIAKPRIYKSKEEQKLRVKQKAEVFTPSWVCNKQNNIIDKAWFGYDNVFNKEIEKGWITNKEKIKFINNRTWQEYIENIRLEITCGEAPYLVSRYDTVSGKIIKLDDRIGILDRKIRIINENVDDESEWYKWCVKAYQNVYGYDWQGDNIFLARQNLFISFKDYYYFKFKKFPDVKLQEEIAEVISYNIWQMDGLKYVIPNSCHYEHYGQITFDCYTKKINKKNDLLECKGCKNQNIYTHNGVYCKIKDWKTGRMRKFVNLVDKRK